MTQKELIRDMLLTGRSINPLQALRLFGCFRLAAVIFELKKQGYDIETTTLTSENGKKFASYSLNNDTIKAEYARRNPTLFDQLKT